MNILIIIPSRYGSTRFEGKPLIDIHGKSLVRRTYEQALKTQLNAKVLVATDDERIHQHVLEFGESVMTSSDHVSGTDRCFEVYSKQNEPIDIVVNLQGDEPFILPSQIEALVKAFENPEVEIATLKKPILNSPDLLNPNIVKVVSQSNGLALYFSRQSIPYIRNQSESEWKDSFKYFRHIGIYAFRANVIHGLSQLKPSSLEIAESLEQLRWLENGYKIHVTETDFVSPAIDTPEDLLTVDNFLKMNPEMI
jgi:3-deoxy-manno-octulosonate cytidylyltransferase (CMP-KDO synthetase)